MRPSFMNVDLNDFRLKEREIFSLAQIFSQLKSHLIVTRRQP